MLQRSLIFSCIITQCRSLYLASELAAEVTLEYLSGLLIGEEIRSAIAGLSAEHSDQTFPSVLLIGERSLCLRYQTAMAEFGLIVSSILEDTAAQGMWKIAEAQGLVTAS